MRRKGFHRSVGFLVSHHAPDLSCTLSGTSWYPAARNEEQGRNSGTNRPRVAGIVVACRAQRPQPAASTKGAAVSSRAGSGPPVRPSGCPPPRIRPQPRRTETALSGQDEGTRPRGRSRCAVHGRVGSTRMVTKSAKPAVQADRFTIGKALALQPVALHCGA